MSAAPDKAMEPIRIRSDYVGAGDYLIFPDDDPLVVNTDYGLQAVDLASRQRWQADFGERCLGVCRRADGMLVASTIHGVFLVEPAGRVRHVNPTLHEIAHAPLAWQDGVLVITLSHVHALDAAGKVRWKYAFKETLGASVRACLVLGAFLVPGGVVLGVVDYNSGLGRVLCLDDRGGLRSASDVGPITYVFPVGADAYVHSISGYGRFESRCIDLDGRERWALDFGGAGTELPDGRIAMLVGNNESPTWDNWELRLLTAGGGALGARKASGHFGYGPVLGADRQLYMAGFFKPFDPAATRLDYTSLVPLPKFVIFDHLLGVKAQPPQYVVFYHRAPIDDGDIELVFADRNAIAFGPTRAGTRHVYFTHNREILAMPLRA
ncbi:MAG: hypothetical protein JXQ29_11105 [Planctomycetes bacterium]|nr:hypothetical protein [Planctomycetota bacterium]